MTDLLKSIWIIAKWFFLEFIPMIITAPLGALGDFKNYISILKYLAIGIPILVAIIIKHIKKHS